MEAQVFEGWAILELMGHRKLAGLVSQQEVAGAAFLRIDVPGADGVAATQFYSPSAVYAITPVVESVARGFASQLQAVPVTRWELPAPQQPDGEANAQLAELADNFLRVAQDYHRHYEHSVPFEECAAWPCEYARDARRAHPTEEAF